MKIGLAKEIKDGEYRVAITPSNVEKLVSKGHELYVESDAGKEAGFTNDDYTTAGAIIVETEKEIWEKSQLVVKVKEILPEEFAYPTNNNILFTYIHSANRKPQTMCLLESGCVAFAYEDVYDSKTGEYPLLTPMSRIAGEVGFLTGLSNSFTTVGGSGQLVCGGPSIKPMKIVILGAGNVGLAVARLACGLKAEVVMMDTNIARLGNITDYLLPQASTEFSSHKNICKEIKDADIVYNCVKYIPGLKLITREMLGLMKPNSLIVDIDAEPNGAIETSQYSTHENPVFYVDGIRHIGIPNLPSAVANTASKALSNATIPYIMEIADKGWRKASLENDKLVCGLDFVKGKLTFKETADAHGIAYTNVKDIL